MIVVTGPESTGKSTLAQCLGEELNLPVVPEAAREYLQDADYSPGDVLNIAQLQIESEKPNAICDTDLQVISIWWAERFGPVPHRITAMRAYLSRRRYLLCHPDLPWEPDPLRENPDDRDRLFQIYKQDLVDRGLDYAEVSGLGQERIDQAIAYCRKWLSAT